MKLTYDDFLIKIKDQYLEDEISINLNSNFRELPGWDSMTGMTILLTIEEEYNVKIDPIQFKKLITIEDLYRFVENHILKNGQ